MKQSIATIITDLEAQKKRLDGSIEWTRNVMECVNKCRQFGQIEFTNTAFILEDTTEVGIALALPTRSMIQDVHVMTLVCTPSDDELAALVKDPKASAEALRLAHMLHWERTKGVKILETWFVDSKKIWQDTEQATISWLTHQVRAWMGYWFEAPPKAVYRKRQKISIESVKIKGH